MAATVKKYDNIPAEKFQFAKRTDLSHDKKFETKPVSYFQGAFRRFAKNKGAVVGGIVILCLVLFAIIAPFFTPFTPAYYDMTYSYLTPKSQFFANSGLDFWDGYKEKNTSYVGYLKDYAIASETGRDVIRVLLLAAIPKIDVAVSKQLQLGGHIRIHHLVVRGLEGGEEGGKYSKQASRGGSKVP